MNKIISRLVLPVLAGMMLMVGQTGMAAAACPSGGGAKSQVLQGVGQSGSNCKDDAVDKTIATVVRLLSYFIGVVATIMIMVSGFKYITAGGDPAKVGNAKSTLVYALIGLAIAAIAQVLVSFVLTQIKT